MSSYTFGIFWLSPLANVRPPDGKHVECCDKRCGKGLSDRVKATNHRQANDTCGRVLPSGDPKGAKSATEKGSSSGSRSRPSGRASVGRVVIAAAPGPPCAYGSQKTTDLCCGRTTPPGSPQLQ